MRVLVVSDHIEAEIENWRRAGLPPDITAIQLSQDFPAVIYDFDTVIIDHSGADEYDLTSINPTLSNQVSRAISQGRVIICIAGQEPGMVEDVSSYPRKEEFYNYAWVATSGILLKPSGGDRTEVTKQGTRAGVKEYMTNLGRYFAECEPNLPEGVPPPLANRIMPKFESLAVIKETDYAVAMEASYPSGGFLIAVPPPKQLNILTFTALLNMAAFYYEKAKRKVFVAEEPGWVEQYKTEEHRDLSAKIQTLEERRQQLDIITYLLYGTGDDLVESVRAALGDIGVHVKKTRPGDNVDLEPEESEPLKVFIEVTGSREPVKKDKKVAQAWEFIRDRDDPSHKLIIVANAYNHLPLEQRRDKAAFTKEVVDLLEPNGILMMTTEQLYFLWKEVQELQKDDAQRRKKIEAFHELLKTATGALRV